jgi:hypothetical protein
MHDLMSHTHIKIVCCLLQYLYNKLWPNPTHVYSICLCLFVVLMYITDVQVIWLQQVLQLRGVLLELLTGHRSIDKLWLSKIEIPTLFTKSYWGKMWTQGVQMSSTCLRYVNLRGANVRENDNTKCMQIN